MNLELNRIKSDGDTTIGILKIEKRVFCGIIEDEFRTQKVWGETRIPAGTYEILLRNEGNMTKRYSAMFPDFHMGMLHLQNVPNFKYVYIHIGNTDDDTAGCLLTNYAIDLLQMKGSKSKQAYIFLYKRVIEAMDIGERIFIKIIDSDI